MRKGIDVSEHQGTINWGDVPKDGIDFVIVRTGYGRSTVDPEFTNNINGAKKNGVSIDGVYHFSYALSPEDARIEAEFVLDLLKKNNIPTSTIVFFDYEYDSVRYAESKGIKIKSKDVIAITEAFVNEVKAAGYSTGIYCNQDYYYGMYDSLKSFPYSAFWYADWRANPNKKLVDICDYHQTSETGTVRGISTNVDTNLTIRARPSTEPELVKTAPKKSIDEVATEVIKGLWGNGRERRQRLTDAGYSYAEVQDVVNDKLKEGKKTVEELATEVLEGKWGNGEVRKKALTDAGYSYDDVQAAVNKKVATPNKTVAPAQSYNKALAGTYVVNAHALNLRYIPGILTDNNVMKILYKGEEVQNYGYFTDANGTRWLYVQVGNYTGHIDASYVKKK